MRMSQGWDGGGVDHQQPAPFLARFAEREPEEA